MKRESTHLTTWGTFVAPIVHVNEITHTPATDALAPANGGRGSLQAKASLNISAVVAASACHTRFSVTSATDFLVAFLLLFRCFLLVDQPLLGLTFGENCQPQQQLQAVSARLST